MFTLNIILLVASVALMVVGLALTWKPNPVYYFNEKTGKADKYRNNHLFLLICFPGITFYFLMLLGISYQTSSTIYISAFLVLNVIGIIEKYLINFESKSKDKTKNFEFGIADSSSNYYALLAFICLITIKIPLIVGIVIAIISIKGGFDMVMNYKRKKQLHLYFNLTALLFLLTLYLISHTLEAKVFPEYLSYVQIILIFLTLIMATLHTLDIKKRSPIYEKQYIEENSLQTNVSNNP